MPEIGGEVLRAWRRTRGWDVPEVARRLRRAADSDPLPVHDALVRMVYRWERIGLKTERYELLYRRLGLDEAGFVLAANVVVKDGGDTAAEARNVMAWIAGTNASDDAIAEMARAASYLAEAHTRITAGKVLSEVLGLHREVQVLLRGGRQRLRQTQELLRIDSGLLAHACVLLGDLGRDQEARDYGTAALLFAQEAAADEGIAWSVKSKTARWQNRFVESAELARRGFEVSGPTPTRVELAYREAIAIALFGDAARARQALQRAERAGETVTCDGPDASVWSFSAVRQAIFSLSVALYTGDPATALRGAAAADACWSAGAAKVPATWTQVRTGAAMAYLMMDSLDGAAAQIALVLDLAPELRIGTVTGYLANVDRMLSQPRFAGSILATGLLQQIRVFSSAAAA